MCITGPRKREREYVRGNVHINSIEGFWATVKRAYVDGCAFRHNMARHWQQTRVRRLLEQGMSVKMPYKTLVEARP